MATTMAELVAVVAAVLAGRAPAVGRRRLSPALLLAVVPALVGLAVPSTHPHVDAGEVAAGHTHAGALAVDPVFSGADTSQTSVTELEAAKRLISRPAPRWRPGSPTRPRCSPPATGPSAMAW